MDREELLATEVRIDKVCYIIDDKSLYRFGFLDNDNNKCHIITLNADYSKRSRPAPVHICDRAKVGTIEMVMLKKLLHPKYMNTDISRQIDWSEVCGQLISCAKLLAVENEINSYLLLQQKNDSVNSL